MRNTPQTEAMRLADEAARSFNDTATYRTCNVSKDLLASMSAELLRLDAIEQRYNEMMANPCPEWDNKAYMQAIANLRAQLAKAVAEEREACAALENEPGIYTKHDLAEAIRARSNT